MSTLEDYMRGMVEMRVRMNPDLPTGYEYRCFEDFVLQRGQLLESSPLTDEEEEIVQGAINSVTRRDGDIHEMKQCFANAQRLVLLSDEPRLTYYEGYAVSRIGFPVHHGWVGINGKVIDLTWRLAAPDTSRSLLPAHPVGALPKPYVYWGFGVESREYIRFRILTREVIGSLLDDMEGDYPLLRGIDPNDDESWMAFAEEVEEALED